MRLVERILAKSKLDKTLASFAKNIVYYGILIFVAIAALFLGCEGQKTDVGEKKDDTAGSQATPAVISQENKIVEPPKTVKSASPSPAVAAEEKEKVSSYSSEEGDAIIERDAWFFSAYNPQTGGAEYYNSNGQLLGKKQR